MSWIKKYWAVVAFIITLVGSVVGYAFAFRVYSSEFQSQLSVQEIKLEMVELKQVVHSKQIKILEKNEAVQNEVNKNIINRLLPRL